MVKLGEIKELHHFEPKYSFSQLRQNLPQRFESQIRIHDSRLYKAVGELTEKACPTEESDYESRWNNFYLPLKRKGYFILIPLAIILYDQKFFLCFPHSENDYLNTVAICYRAIFGSKTDGLSAEQMYRKWADGRDCGMLEIKDKKSKKEFNHISL
jgi:hypothetical protein